MPVYRESGQTIIYDVVKEFSLLVETKTAGDDVYAALDWEEISR